MGAREKEEFIRRKASEHMPDRVEKIMWSAHGLQKLRSERLRKAEVEHAMRDAVMVEDYPMEGRPLPGALVLVEAGGDPVHVVAAFG